MKFLLVDTHNVLHRSRHVTNQGDIYLKTGMALHITLNSIRFAWNKFNADHVVFCGEGRSWRKDLYPQYKGNRAKLRLDRSVDQVDDDKVFFEMIADFEEYLSKKTHCTFLKHSKCEADDFISRFIQNHNPMLHSFVIVSTDTDYEQLLAPNVTLYDGVQKKITTCDGVFNESMKPFRSKNGQEVEKIDPEFALFEKCIRGDKSDNIESAYPGARMNGSAKKVGIAEAFNDRENKGWAWTNFMMQRWTDFDEVEHVVKDDYERNKILIDLTKQPEEIKTELDKTILEALETSRNVSMPGIHFLKFCGKYDLKTIAENPQGYLNFLTAKYKD